MSRPPTKLPSLLVFALILALGAGGGLGIAFAAPPGVYETEPPAGPVGAPGGMAPLGLEVSWQESSPGRYLIQYRNPSGLPLREQEVYFPVPAGSEVVSAQGGIYEARSRQVRWEVGDVGGKEAGSFLVVLEPNPLAGGGSGSASWIWIALLAGVLLLAGALLLWPRGMRKGRS